MINAGAHRLIRAPAYMMIYQLPNESNLIPKLNLAL